MRERATARGFALRTFVLGVVLAVGGGVLPGLSPAAAAAPVPDEVADEATAVALAMKHGKQIRITSATTDTAQVTANPDGSLTMQDHVQPVRVKRDSGWVDVDLNLERKPNGSIEPKAAPVGLVFSAGGVGSAARGPIARLVKGEQEVGFGWDSDLPDAVIDGATVTYPNVLHDVDLRLTANLKGFSEVLVVKNADAAKNAKLKKITFKSHTKGVKIEKSAAPTAKQAGLSSAGLVVKDTAGTQVFSGDASRMWDSTGVTRDHDPLTGPAAGGRAAVMGVDVTADAVAITPDQAFLADPATTYPVLLDPDYSCTTCSKAHHAVVQSPPEWQHAKNFDQTGGDLGDLKVGYLNASSLNASVNGVSRTYLQMNTAGIIGKKIRSATLHTRVIASYSCAPSPTELRLAGWIDANTDWTNQPFVGGAPLSSNNRSNNPGFCPSDGGADFDATSAAVSAAANNWELTTFSLSAANEGDLNNSWRRFDLNPYFEVIYNSFPNTPTELGIEAWGPRQADALPCVRGANRPVVATKTPRLRARLSDPDGGVLDAGFRLLKGTFDNYTWNGLDIHADWVGSSSFAEVTVPAGWVTDQGVYSFHLWSGDGDPSVSSWSETCEFEVDTVAPKTPVISSTDYPAATPSGSTGQTGAFTFATNGNTGTGGAMDVQRYGWSLNDDNGVLNQVVVKAASGSVTTSITPTQSGTNTLYVYAFDRAENRSATAAKYVFSVAGPSGAKGIWKLDESSGTTAADTGGGNRTLTLATGAAFGAGYSANGMTVNGTTGLATTAASVLDTSKAFSVSTWVRLDSAASTRTAVSQDVGTASAFSLQYNKTLNRWALSAKATPTSTELRSATSLAAPEIGQWTHLAGVYEPTTQKLSLYVNGKLEGSADALLSTATAGQLVVGAAKASGNRVEQFAGAVDQVQVWDRQITAVEAAGLNNTGVLRAQYKLDEQTGTAAKDEVSGLNGVVSGAGASWMSNTRNKWAHFDQSWTGSVAAQQPVNFRTDRSYTVSAWVRHDGLDPASRTALSATDSQRSPFLLGYRPSHGKWSLYVTPAVGEGWHAMSDEAAEAGRWTHLVGTFDATTGRIALFVNGVKQATYVNTPDGGGVVGRQGTGGLSIARADWTGVLTDYWKGDVDDARAYSGVLTDDQVLQVFSATPHR
ncbi:LamG-like jellyroll fold domain-containing protein [Umezawaea sp. NPDC059074]|uniref:LamG-like jellyroll fold domain-containing protein n=1 Tax=Umezawaea sp. NPDC059074 TaxID=3346716 RepID=UPI0036AE2D29